MRKTAALAWTLTASIGLVPLISHAAPPTLPVTGFQWLGALALGDLYSTKAMGIYGKRGVIVKEHDTLISTDGGRSWAREKNIRSSENIKSASVTPSLDLLRLSDDFLITKAASGGRTRRLPLKATEVSYLGAAATEGLQQIFLVGGKSVATSAQRLETLPQYAQDPTTGSPRMIMPLVALSVDGGKTWKVANLEGSVGYLDRVEVSGHDVIAWGPYAVYVSGDGGISWKLLKISIPDGEEDAYPVSASIFQDKILVSLKNGRLLIGEISGNALRPFVRLPSGIGQIVFATSCVGLGISPSPTEDADLLMETLNGGEAWSPILRAKKIVTLTVSGSDIYGATDRRAFRLHVDEKLLNRRCLAHPEH